MLIPGQRDQSVDGSRIILTCDPMHNSISNIAVRVINKKQDCLNASWRLAMSKSVGCGGYNPVIRIAEMPQEDIDGLIMKAVVTPSKLRQHIASSRSV